MFGARIQRSRLLLTGCLGIALFALAGCGAGSGTVTGKVTIDGRPVSSGMVHFTSDDGKSTVLAHIGGEGVYSAVDVPSGATKVTVVPLTPISGKAKTEPSAKFPPRYSDPSTSGFALAVQPGANTYDLEMSSK